MSRSTAHLGLHAVEHALQAEREALVRPGVVGSPKMNILFRADLRPYTRGRFFATCTITTAEAPGLLVTVDGEKPRARACLICGSSGAACGCPPSTWCPGSPC
ncbi:hypothetical protein IL992_08655 [Microbispora sp. NEAU-D428]|uniref:hypothetical protein n=1 Tax=Microbispora sitophila TaxID=2771537 RepID=UPI0018683751|nr:hypothetical protein [Microbispora sitophila]MBE3009264.1 hypothetical protein [Microbispora sitophila]